jgi:hypothetical protein
VLATAIMGVGGFTGAMGNLMVMSALENRERKKNQNVYAAYNKKQSKKKDKTGSEEENINVPYNCIGLD